VACSCSVSASESGCVCATACVSSCWYNHSYKQDLSFSGVLFIVRRFQRETSARLTARGGLPAEALLNKQLLINKNKLLKEKSQGVCDRYKKEVMYV